MSIKPIDLQTNISQLHEIGKTEHNKSMAIHDQQHLLDKESADKARIANEKVDETKKGDQSSIREDESGRKQKQLKEKMQKSGEKKKDEPKEKKYSSDDRMGRIIDIFK